MKYDGYYYVEVLIPTEFSLTMKSGYTESFICKKIDDGYDDGYKDIESGSVFKSGTGFGMPELFAAIPLTEYFNRLGLKKSTKDYRKENVYKLVKKNKSNFSKKDK